MSEVMQAYGLAKDYVEKAKGQQNWLYCLFFRDLWNRLLDYTNKTLGQSLETVTKHELIIFWVIFSLLIRIAEIQYHMSWQGIPDLQ